MNESTRPADVTQASFVGRTFGDVVTPPNVKAGRWLKNMRLARYARAAGARITASAMRGRWVSALGSFSYRNGQKRSQITFDGRNGQFHALYEDSYAAGYELETALLVTRLAQGPKAFYDVGANWGYYSLLAAAVPGFSGSIHAFEPNPHVFADLESTIRQADLHSRVNAHPVGVGSVAGSMNVVEADDFTTGLARLEPSGSGANVRVETLDGCGLPPPVLIKIDAEGMEIDVLKGAKETVRTHRPGIIFENFADPVNPAKTLAPLRLLTDWNHAVFMPVLEFTVSGAAVWASYGDPFDQLMAHDENPRVLLFPVNAENRFLFRSQLNLFACHPDAIPALRSVGIKVAGASDPFRPSASSGHELPVS